MVIKSIKAGDNMSLAHYFIILSNLIFFCIMRSTKKYLLMLNLNIVTLDLTFINY